MFNIAKAIKLFNVVMLILVLAFSPIGSMAFKSNKKIKFKMLSRPEKAWSLAHPFIAKKAGVLALKVQRIAKGVEEEGRLGNDYMGGKMDAFRHAYWMASLAQNISAKKVKKLGEAHEKGNYLDFKKRKLEDGAVPDSMSSVMDLANNVMGIDIGIANQNLSRKKLVELIVTSILKGEMKILKKDTSLTYLDDVNNEIDLNDLTFHGLFEPK